MATLNCAVVQLCSTQDVEGNLRAAERYLSEAAEAGARFVALPENAPFMKTESGGRAPIEDVDGPLVRRLRRMAGDHGVWLLVGSYPETVPGDDSRYYNTSVLVDGTRDGAPVAATYRKIHLFDIDIKGSESQQESAYIAPGDEPVVTKIDGVPTGLTICYDLRFPELYRVLVARGARILTVPSAFTEYTGKDHWLPLLRARAIENQCFVVAPNQFGHHGGKRRSYGKSAIIDPWGTPLAVAPDQPGWVMARLDLDHQERLRSALPALSHRHPDL
ncbi:MAG: carbon-nitrogen hydrolase family protein [Myxococcota bacterium]